MPKGIRGSGPYSKFNADGTPKESEATTAGARKTTARKSTTRKTRKTATRRRATTTNGHKPSITDLGSFRSVSVSSDGKIVLESKNGRKVEASFDRPSVLLDLAEDAAVAADEYIANR